jgi:hypothetical protein
MFFAEVNYLGDGPNDRFEITCKDHGIEGNGTDHDSWNSEQCWKVDPIFAQNAGTSGDNPISEPTWWIKHTNGPHDYEWSWPVDFKLEATNQGNREFYVQRVNAVVVNAASTIWESVQQNNTMGSPDKCDEGDCNVSGLNAIHGDGVNPISTGEIIMAHSDTLRDGQVHDVTFGMHGGQWYQLPQASGNVLKNLTITGKVSHVSHSGNNLLGAVTNNLIQDSEFIGVAREIYETISGATGATIDNLTAPTSSILDMKEDWTCAGEGVQADGTVLIQNVDGAQDNGDGTWTICN